MRHPSERHALVLAGLMLTACAREKPHPPSAAAAASEDAGHVGHDKSAPAARTPVTAKPRRGAATSTERAPGWADWDAVDQVVVTTQLGGQVTTLAVPRVGERVGRGAVMAELYSPQARALFAELGVAAGLGEPWLTATRRRLAVAGVPESSIAEAAEGRVPETLAILAPAGGIIVERPVTEGAWIAPGTTLAVIADPARVVVDVVTTGALPEPGLAAVVSDPVTGERWPARVESILPRGDVAGTIVRLRPDGAPRVGRPLIAEWQRTEGEGLWVPRSAVVDTGERRLVFVVDPTHGVVPRPISVGIRTADEVLVLEGLDGTEDIVVAGTFLYDSETQVSGGHAGMAMDEEPR